MTPSRRTFVVGSGAAAAMLSASTAAADSELESLIGDHLAAEIAAFHADDAGEDDVEIERIARLRLLQHQPRTVTEAGRQLSYLTEVPWSGVEPEAWELRELARSFTR